MDQTRHRHGLSDAVADWMHDGGTIIRLVPGESLDCSIEDVMCLLLDGWIMRSRRLDEERTATLATYLPGDVVMLDVWAGAPNGDRVVALNDVEVICRPRAEFEARIDEDPSFARAVMGRMACDARLLREALAAVSRLDARERLLTFLRQTRDRLVEGGSVRPSESRFPFPMTQRQISDVAGITSVHVNRVLSTLKRERVLTITNGMVKIADLKAFERPPANDDSIVRGDLRTIDAPVQGSRARG